MEDEESIRFMLQTKLMKEGYNVTTAANGLHGLQVLRSGKEFDLIICDLKMPGKDGIELFLEMKRLELDTPLVLLTGFPEKNKVMNAIKNGVRDVLLKPIPHQELMSKIEGYIAELEEDVSDSLAS
ncbi:MAG: response regulator [Bdellovibrionales bacterium]|nr:response regulator [Bdellovibrionales bacterium]